MTWLLRDGRTPLLLAVCQALYWTGQMVAITLSGLVGQMLTSDPALATLPMAALLSVAILSAAPLSALMQRHGRRVGFALGAAACVVGGLAATEAIIAGSFAGFCAALALVGLGQAAAQFYQLAALDQVAAAHRGRAVALVLAGGVLAALVAPQVAVATKDLLAPAGFAGCYLALAALNLAILVPVALLPAPGTAPATMAPAPTARGTLRDMVARPPFIAAVAMAAIGQGVMVLVMNATPLAMAGCAFGVAATAGVIRWHVLGMFVPSFVTGRLVDRHGAPAIAGLGVLLLGASALCAASGQELAQFRIGLLLLGIGWNCMMVAAMALLATAHRPEERGRVQGLYQMLVTAVAAVASFASAGLLASLGWVAVNLGALPLLGAGLAMALWLGRPDRGDARSGGGATPGV